MSSLKSISNELYSDFVVAINRYVEMTLVFFNTLVALMLLTAPWYFVEDNTVFPVNGNPNCEISSGTVIAPFTSSPCGVMFTELDEGGAEWHNLHIYVWIYFVFAMIASTIVGYEIVHFGVRAWNNANTIGFIVQLGLLVVQSLILISSDKARKPHGVDDSTARTLTILALSLSSVRLAMLSFFMFITFRYNKRGFLGTGGMV